MIKKIPDIFHHELDGKNINLENDRVKLYDQY